MWGQLLSATHSLASQAAVASYYVHTGDSHSGASQSSREVLAAQQQFVPALADLQESGSLPVSRCKYICIDAVVYACFVPL